MDTTLHLLTLLLAGEPIDRLNEYRRLQYPHGFRRIPVHMTLIPRFCLVGEPEQLLDHLERWHAKQRWPLPLTLTGVDMQFPQPRHIVIGFKERRALAALYGSLVNEVQPLVAFPRHIKLHKEFLPHLTVMKVAEPVLREERAGELNAISENRPVKAYGIQLWRLKDEVWRADRAVSAPVA